MNKEEFKIVNEQKWERQYEYAREYYETNGNLNIPSDYITEDGNNLLVWLKNQKSAYKNGKLTEDKIKKLCEIGFEFGVLRQRPSWDEAYNMAVLYYIENKDTNIPNNYKTDSGFNLYSWANAQRRLFKEGALSKDKIAKLNLIDFDFNGTIDTKWEEHYQEIKEIYDLQKNLNISTNATFRDGSNAYSWIRKHISLYSRGALPKEKKLKLEVVGINLYVAKSNRPWDEVYMILKKYYDIHGDVNIPRHYITDDGYSLGRWINTQKTQFKLGKLLPERKELLEDIGVSFDGVNTRLTWEESFKKAKAYYEEYGNILIVNSYVTEDGYKLGAWIDSQRKNYLNGSLSDEKAKMLQSIGLSFDKKETTWLRMYKLLLQYYKEYGNLNISETYVTKDGYCLGKWVIKQKELYWKGKLRTNQKEKLDAINFTGIVYNAEGPTIVNQKLDNFLRLNFFIVKLCRKLGIDYILNAVVLSSLSYEDFRSRLIILNDHNINYCDENGYLHYIFSMSNEEISRDMHLNSKASRKLTKNNQDA